MERLNTKYPGLQNTQDLFMIISIKIRNQAIIIMTVNYLIAIFISNTLFYNTLFVLLHSLLLGIGTC